MTDSEKDDDLVYETLIKSGPVQSGVLCVTLHAKMHFRAVDRSLQRLKRQGRVSLMARMAGKRPFALWKAIEP